MIILTSILRWRKKLVVLSASATLIPGQSCWALTSRHPLPERSSSRAILSALYRPDGEPRCARYLRHDPAAVVGWSDRPPLFLAAPSRLTNLREAQWNRREKP